MNVWVGAFCNSPASAKKGLYLSYLLHHTTLWCAVHLAIQERHLATVAPAQQLKPSHKVELLVVRDLAVKRRLAREAAEQGWSREQLRDAIGRRGGRGQRRARRALAATLPVVRLATTRVKRLVDFPEAPLPMPPSEQQLVVLLEKMAAALEGSRSHESGAPRDGVCGGAGRPTRLVSRVRNGSTDSAALAVPGGVAPPRTSFSYFPVQKSGDR